MLIENFDVPGEVASMTKATCEQLICGLINGTLAVIDIGRFQIARVLERAHTGTVVACQALRASSMEIVVTQDDSREIKVWNAKDLSIPLIKTFGRSYNPVWYSQSLLELESSGNKAASSTELHILSACGSEPKVVQYRIDLQKKELVAI